MAVVPQKGPPKGETYRCDMHAVSLIVCSAASACFQTDIAFVQAKCPQEGCAHEQH